MIAFWIVAALLVAGALLFVLPPLVRSRTGQIEASDLTVAVYRDEGKELDADLATGKLTPETHAESKRELERRLLEDMARLPGAASSPTTARDGRTEAVLVGVAMPLIAVAIYLYLGSPSTIEPAKTAAVVAGETPSPQQIAQMVEQLAEKLRKNPGDARGWYMLARSYHALGRSQQAVEAFAKAAVLTPNDAQLLADYAEAQAMANGRNLSGKPMQLLQAALKLDPNHQRALALAGTAAFNDGDYTAAIDYWQRLEKTLPPDSENARKMAARIADARRAAEGKPLAAAPPAEPKKPAASSLSAGPGAAAPAIAGTVSLSFALAAQAAPTDTVFVFARAINGPKMPLAVVRAHVKDLPMVFRLDDSMAMAPAMKLSNFQEVMLVARISKFGNATPRTGDLLGGAGPIKLGRSDVTIVIDSVVP